MSIVLNWHKADAEEVILAAKLDLLRTFIKSCFDFFSYFTFISSPSTFKYFGSTPAIKKEDLTNDSVNKLRNPTGIVEVVERENDQTSVKGIP